MSNVTKKRGRPSKIDTAAAEGFVMERGFMPIRAKNLNVDFIQKFTNRLLTLKPYDPKTPKLNESLFVSIGELTVTPSYFATQTGRIVKAIDKKANIISSLVKDKSDKVLGIRIWWIK